MNAHLKHLLFQQFYFKSHLFCLHFFSGMMELELESLTNGPKAVELCILSL